MDLDMAVVYGHELARQAVLAYSLDVHPAHLGVPETPTQVDEFLYYLQHRLE